VQSLTSNQLTSFAVEINVTLRLLLRLRGFHALWDTKAGR
jgi:hypothetical protein